MPEISVVMSVYNGEKYLHEAIDSILNQTFKNFEFIIIDDGSTDNSAEIIKSYKDSRIVFIQQENKGLSVALNEGIKIAYGKYIGRMDADDISIKERLKKQFDFLEKLPECVVVGSNAEVIDINGEYLYTTDLLSECEEIKKKLPSIPFYHSSTMYRKDAFVKCGGYFEGIKHHFEDMILWNKMSEIGELRNIEEPLIKYRVVPSALTNRSLKASLIMSNICNNILEFGTINKYDIKVLDNISKLKSENWKMSNYYLRIGKVYIEKNFKRSIAFKKLILSILHYPINGKSWFNLILLLFPYSLIKKCKELKLVNNIHENVLQTIVKFLMRIKESKIKFNIQEGATFQELFNHPEYLNLNKNEQIELGLKWARNLYQKEIEQQSFEKYLNNIDLTKYFKNAIILDIGCYLGGKTVRWIEKYQGSEIYGVDIDSRFINIAKYFAKEREAEAHFKVNNTEELSFPDAYFDVIITENTLEHVSDVKKVMQECSRVLKKGGFMIVKFPSFWNPIGHHLNLVTMTPFIHWFFKYPVLLKAYFSIMDERGKDALWYRRQNETPLPFEKGYYINGTGAMQFHKLVKESWNIIADGFKQNIKSKSFIKNILSICIKISQIPILRELFPIVYILQKK